MASRRRSSEVDPSTLNTLEKLIFAQAVHEFGSVGWSDVAKLLSKHPLLSRPKGFFTVQSCNIVYSHLLEESGLQRPDEDMPPRAPVHLKLAQHYYRLRIIELREKIGEEETKFKKLVTEIDEIQAKKWDDKILATLGMRPNEQPNQQEETINEEPIISELPEHIDEAQSAEAPAVTVTVHEDTDVKMEATPPLADDEPTSQQSQEPTPIPNAEGSQPPHEDVEIVEEQPEKGTLSPEPSEVQVPQEDDEGQDEDMAISDTQEPVPQEEEEGEEDVPEEIQDAKRKAPDDDSNHADEHRDRKRFRETSELGDDEEPGPSTSSRARRRSTVQESQVVSKKFQNVIGMLHSTISQHRFGNIFHNPIRKSEASDYHDIVKRPMDLKTIKTKVKDGVISNSLEFQRDIYLMFANAMMYNRPGSEIYNMAEEMMVESEGHITSFQQTEGFHRV